jgi:cytochrome c oxidase accessory protein FixG
LDLAPWTFNKILRRGTKQFLFFIFAAAIAHLFLAYFVSIPQLWHMMRTEPGQHWGAFLFVFTASALLYFNFAWFREQLCIVICPYGRIQSALIDDHSLVIGYDTRRGEPRGKVGTPDAGACVDCNRCVQVCPTGIDIRQGLQIECIGCTACVDVCDEVMTKLKRPTGLIRYDSVEGFAGRATRWIRPRTKVYSVLLLLGAGAATLALSTIRPANFGVTRMRGAPYYVDTEFVRNQFLVRLVNKQMEPMRFVLRAATLPDKAITNGFDQSVEVAAMSEEVRPFIIQVPRSSYRGGFVVPLEISDEPGTFKLRHEVEFLGPDAKLLKEDGAK